MTKSLLAFALVSTSLLVIEAEARRAYQTRRAFGFADDPYLARGPLEFDLRDELEREAGYIVAFGVSEYDRDEEHGALDYPAEPGPLPLARERFNLKDVARTRPLNAQMKGRRLFIGRRG